MATSLASSPEDEAIRFLSTRTFHQCLWLPATASHDQLRVTFATTRNFDNASLPAVLFCGPMFGWRMHASSIDHLADVEGVRMIFVDRPGMGGSTRVTIDQRFQVWQETVPVLLAKLDVKHVYLTSHSAGTLFALHTLYHMREILHPTAPYVGFVSPWVHNDHSQATLMSIAAKIPNGAFDGWSGLMRFINMRVAPATSWSGGIVSSVAGLFQGESIDENDISMTLAEVYGTTEETGKAIEKIRMTYFLAEDSTAANEEARLCLRKAGVSWGVFDNYVDYVRSTSQREEERTTAGETKLKVRVFFAASDIMIGKGGRDYFDHTWRDNVGKSIDYESVDLPDTNHDTAILDQNKGALRKIFREIKALHQ